MKNRAISWGSRSQWSHRSQVWTLSGFLVYGPYAAQICTLDFDALQIKTLEVHEAEPKRYSCLKNQKGSLERTSQYVRSPPPPPFIPFSHSALALLGTAAQGSVALGSTFRKVINFVMIGLCQLLCCILCCTIPCIAARMAGQPDQ